MNRVARAIRAVVGIVLLLVLASTMPAGADHQTSRAGPADGDPIRGVDAAPSTNEAGRQRGADLPDVRRPSPPDDPDRGDRASGSSEPNGRQGPRQGSQARQQQPGNGDNGGNGGPRWGAFDRSLRDQLAGSNHAVSVAVSVDGAVAHRTAFGNRVPGQPAQPAHRFRIASISKVYASTAALRLVDQGVLQLDQPVIGDAAQVLGANPADDRAERITLRQLLNHTSGFGGHDTEFFRGGVGSCSDAASAALERPLSSRPGSSYNYSNMNYCLLGLVIEDVTGNPYEQVVRNQVLEPLGTAKMRVGGTFDVRPGDVRHPSSPGRNYMETLGAAGSWLATPSDVVTLMDSLDPTTPGWHPLSNELVAEMKAPGTTGDTQAQALRRGPPSAQWYGLGLMVYEDGSYGHTGTLEGTHTMTISRPDGVTWAVTVSGETPSDSAALRGVMDRALEAAGMG